MSNREWISSAQPAQPRYRTPNPPPLAVALPPGRTLRLLLPREEPGTSVRRAEALAGYIPGSRTYAQVNALPHLWSPVVPRRTRLRSVHHGWRSHLMGTLLLAACVFGLVLLAVVVVLAVVAGVWVLAWAGW